MASRLYGRLGRILWRFRSGGGTEPLNPGTALLGADSRLFRGGGGSGGAALAGGAKRRGHEGAQTLDRGFAIARLGAVALARYPEDSRGPDPGPKRLLEPCALLWSERIGALDVPACLHPGLELVHVLSPRSARARRANLDLAKRHLGRPRPRRPSPGGVTVQGRGSRSGSAWSSRTASCMRETRATDPASGSDRAAVTVPRSGPGRGVPRDPSPRGDAASRPPEARGAPRESGRRRTPHWDSAP